ncbi:hypothetical protein [Novosphingobium sp. 32-60-15]|uniref:hypothetical protein n=1 Tax=Novosphingobium sp. 32-60-15 TaxID=1970410 RepID=UPI0025D51F81|nr:hypothetical protein [Novosphingobium sp. 32-60-15]
MNAYKLRKFEQRAQIAALRGPGSSRTPAHFFRSFTTGIAGNRSPDGRLKAPSEQDSGGKSKWTCRHFLDQKTQGRDAVQALLSVIAVLKTFS